VSISCPSYLPLVLSRGRERRTLSKHERRMQDGYQSKVKGVFIAREVSRRYSNGCTFDSHAPTKMRRFENHASCVGYLDGQASSLAF
jgi:hypothetical protein